MGDGRRGSGVRRRERRGPGRADADGERFAGPRRDVRGDRGSSARSPGPAPPPIAACENANPSFLCWGNANKYVFRGPGINNWDMSVFKNFHFSERWRGQLRVEAYNIWNHTQFTSVNTSATFNTSGVQTNGAFGNYTAAANPRQLQLAARIMF